uniref:Uncharacterized protein n=1 Tax=Hyaloperonospora arabidopsidis (strain Emoy2) TaxID=559515 RepID=M4BWQ1_HYAAE
MATKTTRFLTQFARVVFEQWTQTPAREQFWHNETCLYSILEESVAKLPSGKLKTQLSRDLKALGTQLASLLHELYLDYNRKEVQDKAKSIAQGPQALSALLNEEVTELELELTQAADATSAAKYRRLAGVLALDTGVDVTQQVPGVKEQDAEQLVQLFTLIRARGYETPLEQEHKRGLVLRRLAVCAESLVSQLCSTSSNWSCGAKGDAVEQVQHLRALLERIVAQDAVALAQVSQEGKDGSLKAPWAMFYRPAESRELQRVSYDNEMAKIYGTLLTLGVYFPIDNREEETSDESSFSGDDEEEATPKTQKQSSALAQAQYTTRQILFAAQMRQREPCPDDRWLVSVLSFLQSLHKPTTYLDEDDEEALDPQDRCALLDCVGNLYSRAFGRATLFDRAKESATEEKIAAQDRALFETVLCLRRAVHFMRAERQSALPTITTAMAQLAGVPVPASFVSWMDHEQTTNPESVLEKAIQRLWKECFDQKRMMSMLLSSGGVSDVEMPFIQRSYLKYLDQLAEGRMEKTSHRMASLSTVDAMDMSADTDNLFYVDNAGGEAQEKTSKSKKKRSNKKKKKRTNKTSETSLPKRSRTSSG